MPIVSWDLTGKRGRQPGHFEGSLSAGLGVRPGDVLGLPPKYMLRSEVALGHGQGTLPLRDRFGAR